MRALKKKTKMVCIRNNIDNIAAYGTSLQTESVWVWKKKKTGEKCVLIFIFSCNIHITCSAISFLLAFDYNGTENRLEREREGMWKVIVRHEAKLFKKTPNKLIFTNITIFSTHAGECAARQCLLFIYKYIHKVWEPTSQPYNVSYSYYFQFRGKKVGKHSLCVQLW